MERRIVKQQFREELVGAQQVGWNFIPFDFSLSVYVSSKFVSTESKKRCDH